MSETITTYKGFDGNWQCRDYQYEVGKSYEHDGDAKACSAGFHACEYPLDVFGYYPPSGSQFAVVDQSGQLSRHDGDSKVASTKISIKAKIDIAGLVKAAIEYTTSRCKPVDPGFPAISTGDYGAAISTGYRGAASSTGDRGAASSTGIQGAASSTGEHSVAMACGFDGRAMAGETGAIVLAHRNEDGEIIHIRSSKVGENGIKPYTWYQLNEAGEFVEVPA